MSERSALCEQQTMIQVTPHGVWIGALLEIQRR